MCKRSDIEGSGCFEGINVSDMMWNEYVYIYIFFFCHRHMTTDPCTSVCRRIVGPESDPSGEK